MTEQVSTYGWASDEYKCPYCDATHKYYDIKDSAWFGCTNCDTFFKLDDDGKGEKIRRFSHSSAFNPDLKPGEEGSLDGKKFIVTGFLQKHDPEEDLKWYEYYLYDADNDCHYVLAAMGRDWYFTWQAERLDFRVMNTNVMSSEYVAMQDNPYRKYDHYVSYTFKITYAAGEFDTNILDDEHTLQVEEYADPPDMVASETKGDETTWYRGTHFTRKAVMRGFSKNVDERVAKTFEDNFNEKWLTVRNFSLVMVALVLCTALATGSFKKSALRLNNSFATNRDTMSSAWGKQVPIDAGKIVISNRAALEFDIGVNISNEWMEVAVSLTNEQTGKTYEFTKALEQYSGYEGGESWSEGSTEAEAVLSGVEPGTYQVNVFPSTDSNQMHIIQLQVYENTFLFSNLLTVLLLICAYPIYMMWKKNYHDSITPTYY